jgi:hypothetical protein
MIERTLIERARERVLDKKLWGRTCVNAILDGHWDEGGLIRDAIQEIEIEDLRNMKEFDQ